MSKNRNYRRKKVQEDSDDEDEVDKNVSETIQERKELQKFRVRPSGVSAEELLAGEDKPKDKADSINDPWKLKSGGGLTEVKSKSATELGTTFSSETNQRDEDVQLLRYIEEGLKKKRGVEKDDEKEQELTKEDLLYQLPENINVNSKIMKSEEMLSSQMLSGIPEVDLGIEAKIKNIEATEEAKMKMIEENKSRNQQASVFVPTNMASNFMHHSRFYNEREAFEKEKKKEQRKKQESTNEVVDKGPTVGQDIADDNVDTKFIEKAMHSSGSKKRDKVDTSDDYMFEKFKKRAKDRNWR